MKAANLTIYSKVSHIDVQWQFLIFFLNNVRWQFK